MNTEYKKFFIQKIKEIDIWFLLTFPIGIYLIYNKSLIGIIIILVALFQQHFLGSGAIGNIKKQNQGGDIDGIWKEKETRGRD